LEVAVSISKNLIVFVMLVVMPVANSYAGWMQSEGNLAISSGLGFKDNGNYFDRQGSALRNNCGSGVNVPLYAEYGYSYYNTVYAFTSLDKFNCGLTTQQGFNDVETGIRGRFDHFIDHNWEFATIFPQHLSPNGAVALPKKFGIKAAIHSSSRLDPYESFLTEEEIAKSTLSYGGGVKYWTGDAPGEVWGYLSYGRILKDADWSRELAGWSVIARLDARNSICKTYTATPGNGVMDLHDKFSLLTGQIGLSRSMSTNESMMFFVERGLWGRNVGSPLGVFVTYSRVWRK
jgi:hypothetical protein